MAIAYGGAGTLSTGSSVTELTLDRPAGAVEGDIYIAIISISVTDSMTVETINWTKVLQTTHGSTSSAIFYSIANSEPEDLWVTWASAANCGGRVFLYTGQAAEALGSGNEAINFNTGSTHSCSAITTTANNSWALYFSFSNGNTDLGTPAGWTEDADSGVGVPGTGFRLTAGHKSITTSGTSSGAISVTGDTSGFVMRIYELRAADQSGGGGGQTAAQKFLCVAFGLD
jgi:hypothetical protein